MDEAINLQREYLSEAPSVLKNDFLASLRAAFTIQEVENQLIRAGLRNLSVSAIGDRYLEVVGIIND